MPTFSASSCWVSPSMIRRSRSLAATRRSASWARGLPVRVRAADIELTAIGYTLPSNAAPHKRGAQAGLQPTRSYKTWQGARRLVAEDGRERKHGVSRQKVPKQPKDALPAATGGYGTSRFNALRHGVLSRYTVLPWEDADEYTALLAALAAEHAPRGGRARAA